jgi:hypothetical protein
MRLRLCRFVAGPYLGGEQLGTTVHAQEGKLELHACSVGVLLTAKRGDAVTAEIVVPWWRVEQSDLDLMHPGSMLQDLEPVRVDPGRPPAPPSPMAAAYETQAAHTSLPKKKRKG